LSILFSLWDQVKGDFEVVLKMFCESPPAVAPRRQPRGPSALACLGMTSRDAVPSEARDAVPSASDEGRRPERSEGCLAHARQDKKGARQDGVGNFFEQVKGDFRSVGKLKEFR
jgi:hypothetical protein